MKRIIPLVLVFLTCFTVSAQTINFKLGSKSCNAWNGSYNCAGIPITNVDGSQPVAANDNPATVQSFLWYNNNRLNGFWFLGNYGLGNGVPKPDGTAPNVTSFTVTDNLTTPATYTVTAELAGLMLDGTHTYAGTVSYVYSIGVKSRYKPYTTPWNILGGTGTITVMTPQTVANLSPIAPTPTSCPGCGGHILAGVSAQSSSVPPPGYGTCYGVQIVAGPWNAGPHETCAIYKGYCQVSQEGNIWNWIYWTDCATN